MSGVVVAMRRTLLSCTSLARNGLISLGTAALATIAPAEASDLSVVEHTISTFFGFNRQEIAVLATALALLGFSVMALDEKGQRQWGMRLPLNPHAISLAVA